jgi:hypothetical protein
MATASKKNHARGESTETDFYLPAASISTALDKAGAIVSRLTGGHGVVLIPDSYNK